MHVFEGNLERTGAEFLRDSNRSFFQERVCQIGVLLSIATGFAIPVSTSLTSVLSIGVLICWFVSGQCLVTLELLKKYRVATASLVFFGFLAMGLLYTPEALPIATRNLFKYRQFLLIPIYLTFFLDPQARRRGIQMFELAMVMTLIGSMVCWLIPIEGPVRLLDCAIFKNRITQNILMAFLVYLLAWRFLESPRKRWPYLILAIVATYNILAIVPGRSGYLALGILICVLMYQKMGYKGIIPAVVSVVLVGLLAYQFSGVFQQRIDLCIKQVKEYRVSRNGSSGVDLRLEFYRNGLEIAKSDPLLGSGTGSFASEYRQLMRKKGQMVTENPHNEYVMLLVQNGTIGVFLFLSFFWIAWRATRLMTGLDQGLGQAVLAVYLIVSMVNSLMLDTTEGSLFGFLMGLSLAGGIAHTAEKQMPTLQDSSADDEGQAVSQSAA